VRTRLLFLLVVTPLGVVARPLWRRRLGLGVDRRAASYWHERAGGVVTAEALRRKV
jgi:hypothetical protein